MIFIDYGDLLFVLVNRVAMAIVDNVLSAPLPSEASSSGDTAPTTTTTPATSAFQTPENERALVAPAAPDRFGN